MGGQTRTLTVLFDKARAPRAVEIPSLQLTVLKGPDRRREVKGAHRRVLIGTGEAALLRLSDPTVSALHCEVWVDSSGHRVRDLDSKNGVLLGEHRVAEAWLKEGDRLVLGTSVLRFSLPGGGEEQPLAPRSGFGRMVGGSVAMRQLYAQLERAADSEAAVLLSGETGTGKELAAEALVGAGPRREGPVVVVDCGRLPQGLAESELFGHEEGAFSGATRRHVGAFERAHGGTILLDEVGELPLELQPKLLGALERRVVQRVGGREAIGVDVRVISATHRDLEKAVNQGRFRADLYYRLSALAVRLPPLRERQEDIPGLVAHFLEALSPKKGLPAPVLERIFAGDYPGNVRELRNVVERAVAGLEVAVPPRAPGLCIEPAVPYKVQKDRLLAGFEHAYFEQMVEACGGNLSELSRRSGLSRFHIHEVVRRLGLKRSGTKLR